MSTASRTVVALKSVVIIGNGVAGSQLTAALNATKKYNITVITPFPYQEISLQMTSVVASGSSAHNSALYENVKEEGVEYVVGVCAELRQGAAILKSGEEIPFDVCVVCTGQRIPIYFPDPEKDSTAEARRKSIADVHSSIERAESIVIAGGGPVGVETAADIKLRYPQKRITLVHPHATVLNAMSPAFSELATARLAKIGVEVILNDRVTGPSSSGQVQLRSGKSLVCDYFISANASGGNSSFMPAASVDSRGYIKMNEYFEVTGLRGVFSLGDCTALKDPKTYGGIQDKIPTLVYNIAAYCSETPMKLHKKGFEGKFHGPVMVALGHGVRGSYGVGPDMPGCFCSTFCWVCCCFGYPCSHPAGEGVAKMKYDFNKTIMPRPGKGIHR